MTDRQTQFPEDAVSMRSAIRGEDHIPVRAEMWMRNGEWKLLVRAPEWIVSDFARHGSGSRYRRVWIDNYGGGAGGYSFLLGTYELTKPTRRERFARWLFRFPHPTHAAWAAWGIK